MHMDQYPLFKKPKKKKKRKKGRESQEKDQNQTKKNGRKLFQGHK